MGLTDIRQSIIDGQAAAAAEATEAALKKGISAHEILNQSFVAAMETVGQRFTKGEYFFPELLLAGEAMKTALQRLRPALSKSKKSYVGRYAIGTVAGDIHDVGKNVVVMFLEANGWEVTDLGIDVPTDRFCQAVKEGKYDILGMSALVTTTMPRMAEAINALKRAGLRRQVKVMVGGAPVTQAYAEQIGADAYARDAAQAATKAKNLLKRP